MDNEEAMGILHTAAEKHMRCGISDARAAEILQEMLDRPGITGEQMIALGLAIGRLEKPDSDFHWQKSENEDPDEGRLILMASAGFDRDYLYHVGARTTNCSISEWAVQGLPTDITNTRLNWPPVWWCYIDKPEE